MTSLRQKVKTEFITQTQAKNDFLDTCRRAIKEQMHICIKDQSDKAFLTITFTDRHISGPAVDVTAQFFKNHFSRCCSLVRDGVAFRLALRASNKFAFARRHTSYVDPLDEVIEQWREKVIAEAITDSEVSKLRKELDVLAKQGVNQQEELRSRLQKMALGIARMAIGQKPFDEGELDAKVDLLFK
jgi:hypothetical protein